MIRLTIGIVAAKGDTISKRGLDLDALASFVPGIACLCRGRFQVQLIGTRGEHLAQAANQMPIWSERSACHSLKLFRKPEQLPDQSHGLKVVKLHISITHARRARGRTSGACG